MKQEGIEKEAENVEDDEGAEGRGRERRVSVRRRVDHVVPRVRTGSLLLFTRWHSPRLGHRLFHDGHHPFSSSHDSSNFSVHIKQKHRRPE